jgi:tRNA threonylcarbamoyladenosine biosynthesis protein TsaE
MMKLWLSSIVDTNRLAAITAEALRPGDVLGLSGPLGAGKTAFVRAFVQALGGDGESVSSPSYVLQNEYPLANKLMVEHWDLYRLHRLPEELLDPPNNKTYRLIEWPDRVPGFIEEISYLISIMYLEGANSLRSTPSMLEGRAVDVMAPLAVLFSEKLEARWRVQSLLDMAGAEPAHKLR